MAGEHEKKLIQAYLAGDEKSLEFLIGEYLRPIYNFVYRYVGNAHDAEDVAQEVFVRMWRNIRKFDLNKNFKTWLLAIARNAAIDFLRKKKDLPMGKFEDEEGENMLLDSLADPAPLISEILEQEEAMEDLRKIVRELPIKYQVVLSLHHESELNFNEIAEILGEPLNTVKSRYRRALLLLREKIKNPSRTSG